MICLSSDLFLVRAAHGRQQRLLEAPQLLSSFLGGRRGGVGGGGGGHVGHGLDDLSHKVGMTRQLNLEKKVLR